MLAAMSLEATERSAAPARDGAGGPRRVSVIVPVFNEAESIRPLVEKLTAALGARGEPYEILFVDDGSTDRTFLEIAGARERDPVVRAIRFRRNFGKSAALAAGFHEVTGDIVVTIDGDLQDEPAEIPNLIARLDEGYDLVSGWKLKRRDPLSKRLPSRLYNLTTRRLSGLDIHDFNCGLKAYRREVTDTIAVYGELHRYIPALAHWAGFRVTELPVTHHPRPHGRSKFGTSRYLNGLLDLLGVMFLNSSERSPLHLFGRIGLWTGAAGALICLVFLVQWVLGSPLRVRPLMLFGVALILLGVQFVSMGFLGELIAKEHGTRPYPIRDRLG